MSKITDEVLSRVAPTAEKMGIILVDVEQAKMGKQTLVRIYVDCEGGIDIDKCEEFHRSIVDILDDVDYDYLEVSSPGDRPLKTDADFKRMAGREVELSLYAKVDGKKRFEGVLDGRSNDVITISSGDETTEFKAADVAWVKPLFRME